MQEMLATDASTVYAAFAATAVHYSEHDFLHIPIQACKSYSQHAITWRYGEALEAIDTIAKTYRDSGLSSGDRVSLVLENRPEFFLHYLALNSMGVCIVPVHADAKVAEISYLIERSEASAVICLAEHTEKLTQAIQQFNGNIPCVSPEQVNRLQIQQTAGHKSADDPGLNTPAAILFTSGTTGKPKGCVLPNRYFQGWSRMYPGLGAKATLEPGAERLITPLPTNHTNALGCSFMGMVASGGCVVQVDRFSSSTWWQSVRDSRATILHYLGVMPAMLLNMPEREGDDFNGQIKFGLGAGVDPAHHREFEQRFGFPLLEGWAMTETGGELCIMAHKEPRHVGLRCIGVPPAHIDFKIVDEQGQTVEQGEAGELLVRRHGDQPRLGMFSEYYRDEKSTSEAWEGDYFHTGDVLYQGEDGSLFFMDRRKNVIRRSGENISAAEVEEVLLAHAAVAVCAVAAVADELREEEVMALIVLNESFQPSEQLAHQIVSDCLASLSYFKVPGHIGFVSQLPISSTQKIKQGEIKGICDGLLGGNNHFDTRGLKRASTS